MTTIHRPGPVTLVLALAGGALLAACSGADRTAPQPLVLSQAEADSMGDVVVADVENELDAGTATTGIGFVPGAPLTAGLTAAVRCVPEVAPLPVVNSDADRVPDSIRVTFTDCVIGYRRGADTIRGSIDIVDPTPMGTDGSIKLAFIDFARIFVDRHNHTASLTVNGSREAIRDADQLSQTEQDFRTDYAFGNGATASHVRNWAVVFQADVAGSIVHDAALPSGVLTVNGTSTFTRDGTTTFDLQVTTDTPFRYDATCTDRPRFSAGKLVAVVTKHGATATITIEFTACGQYTVTKS
jgi:hypothetical protein